MCFQVANSLGGPYHWEIRTTQSLEGPTQCLKQTKSFTLVCQGESSVVTRRVNNMLKDPLQPPSSILLHLDNKHGERGQ
jgi:hypothetical protein